MSTCTGTLLRTLDAEPFLLDTLDARSPGYATDMGMIQIRISKKRPQGSFLL
jgi:hypothetical protein